MDFTILTEHFVLVVLVACLVIGYVIKHDGAFCSGGAGGLSGDRLCHQARFVPQVGAQFRHSRHFGRCWCCAECCGDRRVC